MFDSIASVIGLVALAAATALVAWQGGPAERGGMALIVVSWLGMLLAQAITREVVPDVPFLVSDVALSIGFLFLALRYGSLWLGGAMLVQALLFGLHLWRFEDGFSGSRLYLTSVNVLSYCILAIIMGAAVANWRRRRRQSRRTRDEPGGALFQTHHPA